MALARKRIPLRRHKSRLTCPPSSRLRQSQHESGGEPESTSVLWSGACKKSYLMWLTGHNWYGYVQHSLANGPCSCLHSRLGGSNMAAPFCYISLWVHKMWCLSWSNQIWDFPFCLCCKTNDVIFILRCASVWRDPHTGGCWLSAQRSGWGGQLRCT